MLCYQGTHTTAPDGQRIAWFTTRNPLAVPVAAFDDIAHLAPAFEGAADALKINELSPFPRHHLALSSALLGVP